MPNRRSFLATSAAFAALGAAPRLWAATEADLGASRSVTTLSDGHLTLPESFVIGDLDPAAVKRILDAAGTQAGGMEPPCNLTLMRHEDALVLFDAGSGHAFMPTAGKLMEALDAAGVAADDITHVIFTHGHPDHLWGVLDDFDEPVFANAQHLMGAAERAYWSDPETVNTIAPERQSFAAGAQRRIELLGDRLASFDDGETILPGIAAVATPGHTPGHMSFELSGDDGRVFLIGDAIGNAHVALAQPSWHAPADQDPKLGVKTRLALLERLAEDGTTAIGFHLPGGGIGRITRDGDVFGWDAG
ncbi:MBL fold metallo-hydrolase [Oceaniglobus roseus]|uniref:MBL fold metallo-hydrolase n=1 Tax=Oceaniglobus roseus TaxID=1737570 RepID=UPI000C7E8FD6|nr:MBL fold metallo-hydrolase [Kandeliimicrobium roseum]